MEGRCSDLEAEVLGLQRNMWFFGKLVVSAVLHLE